MRLLVTGGAGYIGTHTVVVLLEAGHEVTILDNLSNSDPEAVRRVRELSGSDVELGVVDLCDREATMKLTMGVRPEAVIHFAGLKAVGESVSQPRRYYENNLVGTLNLLEAMDKAGCHRLVFSSSATVYGTPKRVPITEDFPRSATNPYGWTKYMIEQMLCDTAAADDRWSFALLRYFNPVGAHASGRIGEDPKGIPNNLMPYITQVAVGRREFLTVYGDDYETHDGTGVRDYIHVMDLAAGHLAALDRLAALDKQAACGAGCWAWNLGTGRGSSVLEVVKAFERACDREIPYKIAERRPGDISASYADPSLAKRELGWTAELDLDRMCTDSWRWQSRNPNGYAS